MGLEIVIGDMRDWPMDQLTDFIMGIRVRYEDYRAECRTADEYYTCVAAEHEWAARHREIAESFLGRRGY